MPTQTLTEAIRECFTELVNRPDGCHNREIIALVKERYPELVAQETETLITEAITARIYEIGNEPAQVMTATRRPR